MEKKKRFTIKECAAFAAYMLNSRVYFLKNREKIEEIDKLMFDYLCNEAELDNTGIPVSTVKVFENSVGVAAPKFWEKNRRKVIISNRLMTEIVRRFVKRECEKEGVTIAL